MADLYSTLPAKAYSIQAFNAEASRLNSLTNTLESDDEIAKAGEHFIDFVLTGRNVPGNHQAAIDVNLNAEVHELLFVTRDYDSLIAISPEIRVTRTVNVFPVSNPNFALSTSIHLAHTISEREVSIL